MPYKILHITKDDKFFDRVITAFDSDERVESRCVLINETKKPLQYISRRDRVLSVTTAELRCIIKRGDYDAVYYHSIPESIWRTVLWIPKGKVIIWWSWGYDLYRSRLPFFRPLLPMELYKEQTKKYIRSRKDSVYKDFTLLKYVQCFVKSKYFEYCRKKALKLIDYYAPVIPQEYELLVHRYDFHAKLFYNPRMNKAIEYKHISDSSNLGYILLCNSASISNNHLDVWKSLEVIGIRGRKLIIPVSYGDEQYRDYLKEQIVSKLNEIVFLQDLLPYEEYSRLLDGCRFALFGVIRQQAYGNIVLCLQRGIKVFLYEDSMVYRFLKDLGCYVYAIDKLNESEISMPLTESQAEHNFQVWSEFSNACLDRYNSVIDHLIEGNND